MISSPAECRLRSLLAAIAAVIIIDGCICDNGSSAPEPVAVRACLDREEVLRQSPCEWLVVVPAGYGPIDDWAKSLPYQLTDRLPEGFNYDTIAYRDTHSNKRVAVVTSEIASANSRDVEVLVTLARGGRAGIIWSVSLEWDGVEWRVVTCSPVGGV